MSDGKIKKKTKEDDEGMSEEEEVEQDDRYVHFADSYPQYFLSKGEKFIILPRHNAHFDGLTVVIREKDGFVNIGMMVGEFGLFFKRLRKENKKIGEVIREWEKGVYYELPRADGYGYFAGGEYVYVDLVKPLLEVIFPGGKFPDVPRHRRKKVFLKGPSFFGAGDRSGKKKKHTHLKEDLKGVLSETQEAALKESSDH